MAFVVRHSSGIVCAPLPPERADSLRLPLMVSDNTDAHGTAFTVTVDAVGTGTGVSAADRTATFRAPATRPEDLHRPGHVFPLRARTNNPAKYGGLDGYGLDIVARVALPVVATPHNVRYLRTKRERMGHELTVVAEAKSPQRRPETPPAHRSMAGLAEPPSEHPAPIGARLQVSGSVASERR